MRTRLRCGLAAALCLGVALGPSAVATPKHRPVCNLIVDGAGDADIVTPQPALDVVSGDIASDSSNVTVVFRLDGRPGDPNPQAPGGTRYFFEFGAPGSGDPQYLSAAFNAAGLGTYRTGHVTKSYLDDPANPAVRGSVAGNVVTISAPLSAFTRVKLAPSQKLTRLTIETFTETGTLFLGVDDAAGGTYTTGAPSCVVPGKG